MCKAIAEVRFDSPEWIAQVRKKRTCSDCGVLRHGDTDAESASRGERCPMCNEARILAERCK